VKISFIDTLFNNKLYKIIFFVFLSIIIFAFSYNNGMFWDNVLFTSKMGNYLLDNSIFNFILPDQLDPGHPPTLGFLLAVFWKIFGHKLWVSHLLMIPFTVGLFYQVFQLIKFYVKSNIISFLGFILVFSDPTLATQLVIVNHEIIQLFFFFLVINSILKGNYYLKVIALFFLCIISLRGMMLCAGVFLFEFLNLYFIEKQKIKTIFSKKIILSYIIGSIPGLIFIVSHYISKGWILTHPSSPWEEHHHLVSISGFIRNLVVMTHRYLDFGRVFIFIFIFYSVLKFKKNLWNKSNKQLLLLSITSVILIVVASLLKTNPFGHRYFIASYICLTILALVLIQNNFKNKKIIYTLLLAGLISGNLWIYPRNIAQGWDATLAHVPYYNLRIEAINYLDKNNIEIDDVGTFFPNLTSIDNVDLSGDMRSFSSFNGENNFLFYSNVYNLTDEEYDIIDTKYTLIKQFNKFNIHVNIYKLK
jgi:hypothetical protein